LSDKPLVTMSQLLESGAHFGHQTRRWNPKMKPYLYQERNGIYLIDLRQTLVGIDRAYRFIRSLAERGGTVLFVGTKKQAQDAVGQYARMANMPYVSYRWPGGMLTNFSTMTGRVRKLQEYEAMRAQGDFEAMPKKESLHLQRELTKLELNVGGVRHMTRLPDALFVVDTVKEHIAVSEANRLGIPIVAVVDSNSDPDQIDYLMPGNDDAIRSCEVFTRVIASAVIDGRSRSQKAAVAEPVAES